MENNEEIVDAIKESKYNSGVDKIYTMGAIRKAAHDFKIGKEFAKWYQCLRSWRSEINSKLSEEERDRCKEFHELFDSFFYKRGNNITVEVNKIKIRIDNLSELELDNNLYEYELYLGDLLEKHKMGMPDADDDEGL